MFSLKPHHSQNTKSDRKCKGTFGRKPQNSAVFYEFWNFGLVLIGNLHTVLVGSCFFLIDSAVPIVTDPRTVSLTVLEVSFGR